MPATAPVCLITGSATGIGAACARQFAARGWHVALSHLDDSTFAEARTLAGPAVRTCCCKPWTCATKPPAGRM